ncbi:MAG: tetratricopeptide repeat protein [Colwellia sp.]|nr:tetratricopeptide repeat protein [Colwellia sp.]
MSNASNSLQQALAFFQAKDFKSAELICKNILKKINNQVDALHLLALIYKQQQQFSIAEEYFNKSLKANPLQPVVLLNFANFLTQTNQFESASSYYQKSYQIAPTNLDLLYNWSLLLNRQSNYKKTISIIDKAIKINDKHAGFFNILGNAYKNLAQYDQAIIAFKKALTLNPNDFFAWHNLGVTYRINSNANEAIKCYQKIQISGEKVPEFHFNLGCAYYDTNQMELAELSLKKAIALRSDYVMAHEALNKLYWENSQQSQFLNSYSSYMQKNKASEDMYFSFAAQLILSTQLEEAKEALKSAINTYGAKANFCHALATIYIKQGIEADESLNLLNSSIRLEPNNIRYRIDMANILIKQENYKTALQHLNIALKVMPLNQELWGYIGLCWRLLNDEREHWLNNYDQFVVVQKIDTPLGYDNLEHFIYELQHFMKSLHNSTQQPLDQSVMGGSQTTGNLLLNSAPIIQKLKTAINNNANKYINSLPKDPSHPFLSRITESFNFAGCWSVLLKKQGFHTNHLHPEGWISGPTYIDIPKNISPEDPLKSGWVHFGETSLNLGDREKKSVEHCPQEGDCVFFPSYMWHGTNPTISDEIRMTTPCDIQPL